MTLSGMGSVACSGNTFGPLKSQDSSQGIRITKSL
jgi:hypothetical protein